MHWSIATNKHPNCNGTAWGWIDGTEPRVYWSNEYGAGLPSREQAERIVAEHNAALRRAGEGA